MVPIYQFRTGKRKIYTKISVFFVISVISCITVCFVFISIYSYLTECYDELGTQYKVPIYCLSYPINIVKEDNGRDSPAEYSEPVDGGAEITLKLRLSSSFSDTKLTVYSKDTIGQCKKKLQV